MKSMDRRTLGLGAAALIAPFAFMGSYVAMTHGGTLPPRVELDWFFLVLGLGIGCICLWGLPWKTWARCGLMLPYLVGVGCGVSAFIAWFRAGHFGMGP